MTEFGSGDSALVLRAKKWAPMLAIGLYAVAALIFWTRDHWRPDWDSAIYLLTAASLQAGEGYRYLGEPFFLRPPGFSWLLSFAAGPNGFDFAMLNRLGMAFTVAAVGGVYWAMGPSLGRARSLGVALLTGTSGLWVARFNFVLSDLPFLALLFPALALFDLGLRGERGERDRRWEMRRMLGGAVLLAAAAYLRTAALAALPGLILLYAWRRRGRQRWLGWLPGLGVCAAMIPWLLYARRAAREAVRPSEQLLLFDYMTALLRQDSKDPGSALLGLADWWTRIVANSAAITQDLAIGAFGSEGRLAVTLVVIAVALGIVAALRRGPDLIDGFAFFYSGLLVVYFTSDARLVIPLVPIVYRACFEAVGLIPWISWRRPAAGFENAMPTQSRAALVSAGILVVGFFAVNLAALPTRLDAESMQLPFGRKNVVWAQGAVWRDMESAADWLATQTPPDAHVISGPAPSLSLLSGRRVYSYRFFRQGRLIDRYEARYAVIFPWAPPRIAAALRVRATKRHRLPSVSQPNRWIEMLEYGTTSANVD